MTTSEKIRLERIERRRRANKKLRQERLAALGLVVIFVVFSLFIYKKTNMKRECLVTNINDKIITVRHPNQLEYSIELGDTVTVSFDEFFDWEKDYSINFIQ